LKIVYFRVLSAMPADLRRRRFHRWVFLALPLVLAAGSACNLDRFRGEGFKGESKQLGGGLRPQGNPADHGGFSTKAQEIESHLGS
jgi:hypothetical protein